VPFGILLSLLTPCLYIYGLKWATMAKNWNCPTTYIECLSIHILIISVLTIQTSVHRHSRADGLIIPLWVCKEHLIIIIMNEHMFFVIPSINIYLQNLHQKFIFPTFQ